MRWASSRRTCSEGWAVTYIRNWPEGLFILLVGFPPAIVGVWATSSDANLVYRILAIFGSFYLGLALWAGIVWLACRTRPF